MLLCQRLAGCDPERLCPPRPGMLGTLFTACGPSMADGGPEPAVRLACCARSHQAGHAHPMASQGVPPVLGLEVEAGWKAAVAEGSPGVDPEDGRRESDLRRGAHRQRVEAEAGYPGFAPDGPEVSGWRGMPRPGSPDPLQALPPESRHRHCLPAGHFVRSRAVLVMPGPNFCGGRAGSELETDADLDAAHVHDTGQVVMAHAAAVLVELLGGGGVGAAPDEVGHQLVG